MLLLRDEVELVVESLGERGEELLFLSVCAGMYGPARDLLLTPASRAHGWARRSHRRRRVGAR